MTPSQNNELELKLDGKPIRASGGAPAEILIDSLIALQRLTYLIGMKKEGYFFGQRVKPSAKVRREYSLICKVPEEGSHIQPLAIVNANGIATPAALAARQELLQILKAFDSGSEQALHEAIPDARQRWFLADAAFGLIPKVDNGLIVTLRSGRFGPFDFRADRARGLVEKFREGKPPTASEQMVVGKVKALDFGGTQLTLQPSTSRSVKLVYPPNLEPFLQQNRRKRISVFGIPELNPMGDITGFEKIVEVAEVEPSSPGVEEFTFSGRIVRARKPLRYTVKYDYQCRVFLVQSERLGVDVISEDFEAIRGLVEEDLGVLWRNYALAKQEDLTDDAATVKRHLLSAFSEVE